MNAAQFLIDTSALARLLRGDAEQYGWDRAAAAGLIATCPITELEFFCSARSPADRAQGIEDMRLLFGWVPVDDRAYDRAWRVQELLTQRGQHRSAGTVIWWWPPQPSCRGSLCCTATGTSSASPPSPARHSSGTALTPASEPGAGGTLGRLALHSRNAPRAEHVSRPSRARIPSTPALGPPRSRTVPTACP